MLYVYAANRFGIIFVLGKDFDQPKHLPKVFTVHIIAINSNHLAFSFDPENQELKCYNVIAAEARSLNAEEKVMSDIFKSELAVPTCTGSDATRSHCALHVLGKRTTFLMLQLCHDFLFETKHFNTVWTDMLDRLS